MQLDGLKHVLKLRTRQQLRTNLFADLGTDLHLHDKAIVPRASLEYRVRTTPDTKLFSSSHYLCLTADHTKLDRASGYNQPKGGVYSNPVYKGMYTSNPGEKKLPVFSYSNVSNCPKVSNRRLHPLNVSNQLVDDHDAGKHVSELPCKNPALAAPVLKLLSTPSDNRTEPYI